MSLCDEVGKLFNAMAISWDENGNIAGNDDSIEDKNITYTFNWDNKLRKAQWNDPEDPEDSIEIKYDPFGNRVYKKSTAEGESAERKYIVDITGNLPTILLEIEPDEDPADSSLKKTYIYADRQILAQHDGDRTAAKYFYLHDRLGSVRLVIDDDGDVQNTYTYEPFGEMLATEVTETTENPFKFTGQYFDAEIDEYYLRARQYNPALARFTARDPIKGTLQTPLTLNQYLYCLNDSINRTDPSGEKSLTELKAAMGAWATAFGSAAYNFGGKVMEFAQEVVRAAYVRAFEIGWYIQGVSMTGSQQHYDLSNKLHHIFDRGGLSADLAKHFGSRESAFWAVQGAINTVMTGVISGEFNRVVVEVGGHTVSVSGNVIDGVVKIGTFVVTGTPGG